MSFSTCTLYYLSGTGNTLTAVRKISENLNAKGIRASQIAIDRSEESSEPAPGKDALIGFCYPTHGFSLPWIMLKFILRFPSAKDQSVMLMNSRAGAKYLKWYGPGVSGIALILPLLILRFKGFRIRYLLSIDPPSNWISVHPGYGKRWIDGLWKHADVFIDKLSGRIIEGKRYIRPNFFWMMPFDLALVPISIMYSLFGRFFMAKTFIAGADCNACRICEQKCPARAIRIRNNKPYWSFRCESCMRCLNICPSKSIQASHSLVMIMITVFMILPVSVWIGSLISNHPGIQSLSYLKHIDFVISWSISLLITYFIYWGVFYLMQMKWVARVMEYTSLTKYWRRYVAPGIRVKDFGQTDQQVNKDSGISA